MTWEALKGMFDYDWFHGPALTDQVDQAKARCALKKFPDQSLQSEWSPEAQKFIDELESRTLIYLRDGFSYEIKDMVERGPKAHLTFECEPVEEQYKVGSFIVSLPYEEILRVEVFAVHPAEKPEDVPLITGFRGTPDPLHGPPREESHPPKVPAHSEDN